MNKLQKTENILPAFADLTKRKVFDMILNFVTGPLDPLQRAKITYWFKEVSKQIDMMDKTIQTDALRTIYEDNKQESFDKVELEGGFEIVRRDNSEYKYSDEARATEIMQEILRLQKELKDMKQIKVQEKFIYYLKNKGLKNE